LRPKQTKSGAYDRKQCFAIIKAHLAVSPEDKAKFTIDGKNVTQLSTSVVQDLVAKYCSGVSAPAVTEAPVKEKACVAEATSKGVPVTDAERVIEALRIVAPLHGYDAYDKVVKHLQRLSDEISTPVFAEESEEEDEIAREAREMLSGY
jgi:hypothetical protein